MRNLITIATFLFIGLSLSGQDAAEADTLWKFSGVTSLNLSQLSLSNWAAGGENSISGHALIKFSPDYDNSQLSWDNDLVLGFGLNRQGNNQTTKSDDQIDISSKFGYRASDKWNYSVLLSFKTQFAEGYDNPGEDNRIKISDFMSPGYLNTSAGMEYKPKDNFSLLLAPVSGKFTFVLDENLSAQGVFGLEQGETIRGEFGGFVKMAYKKEILKNVLLDTKIDLFTNYLENPQYVDVNWDLLLVFRVNQYISATLMTQLIYDYDIEFGFDTTGDGIHDTFESRVQFKELFGLGLSYNF